MAMKLKLVGCDRYNFRGELYERGKVYLVGTQKSELMLRAEDEFGRPYFVEYRQPVKSDVRKVAEKAAEKAAAAAKAEEEAQVVSRPDGSEPKDSVAAQKEADPDASVEVDTDDDPELDEDVVNDEAIDEDVDRDDGTAVKV